jgi:hypothetical protein
MAPLLIGPESADTSVSDPNLELMFMICHPKHTTISLCGLDITFGDPSAELMFRICRACTQESVSVG